MITLLCITMERRIPMKISEILSKNKATLSFEVFPPKTSDSYKSVETATAEIAKLKPDFMSVTYGAGGGTSEYTASIASNIQKTENVPTLAHLTCVSSKKEKVHKQLKLLEEYGIENIMALRGDRTECDCEDYHYASELISDIKNLCGDKFCIGGACYPECHPESNSLAEDIEKLKIKVEAGCEFLTTQMFFDNNILYKYIFKLREAGVTVPVVAGIMPVTNANQITRICALSGTYLPSKFKNIVDKFGSDPDSMKQAGIAYATEQIVDLIANGVKHIHVYSMNKPDIAEKIQYNLSDIIGK